VGRDADVRDIGHVWNHGTMALQIETGVTGVAPRPLPGP
jgi:hypothetical protein